MKTTMKQKAVLGTTTVAGAVGGVLHFTVDSSAVLLSAVAGSIARGEARITERLTGEDRNDVFQSRLNKTANTQKRILETITEIEEKCKSYFTCEMTDEDEAVLETDKQ